MHLAGENLADASGIEIQHVPYKGEAPAYTDLMGGQTQLMVGNIAAAAALLGPGRLRALAVTGKERSPLLPDVPTVAESGLPGFVNTGWFGLLAPAGTPPEVVAKIQQDTTKAVADTQMKARLQVLGMEPVGSTSADFARQMEGESTHWAQVVKKPQAQSELSELSDLSELSELSEFSELSEPSEPSEPADRGNQVDGRNPLSPMKMPK